MSTLDWLLVAALLGSIGAFASLGLIRAASTGAGALLAFFILTPFLTEPGASLLALAPSLINLNVERGLLRGLAVMLIVLTGAGLGNLLGGIFSWPIEIIPGINVMNTLGGAAVGLVVGVLSLGLIFTVTGLALPGWTAQQLSERSWLSSIIAQNLSRLALLMAPADLKASLDLLTHSLT